MAMILGVHHAQISIPTGKEEEARAFYCIALGFPEVPKPADMKNRGGFWMQLPNLQIHVGTEEGFDRQTTKAHVAYAVNDIAVVREVIEAYGLPIQESFPISGYLRFECRDPFGNRVEFIQRV
jgi:catechol 2,3-dioxygenase-like lactoylglutathione lyase family enzyme